MKATELLQFQMHATKSLTSRLLADMQDAPFVRPTVNGGNHPTWIAGHLAYSEANLVYHILGDEPNPLAEWKSLFGRGSDPADNTSQYPPLADILAKWDEVREHSLQVLLALSEEDLDRPAANPPPGREEFFGTYGKILSMTATHAMMHYGQVADARRAAGREKLMS